MNKRFETKVRMVIDTEKKYGARVLNAEEIVELLNKLCEENEQLNTDIQDIQTGTYVNARNTIKELKKENGELKNKLKFFNELNKPYGDIIKENEQLKFDKTNLHQCMSKDRVKYNQFKDKVFCCIDKKIKLLKDCFMSNEAKILEDLKKEICDWND